MSSRAIRLSRIHALNWYGYQDSLPVEGNLVLAGVTGSGKSILMDLVMLVLVGPERARHHFNRSATGSQSDRTLKSYCLLDTKREENGQPQYYRDKGGISYIALEFTWPDSDRIETWGLRIEFRSASENDGNIKPFFCKGALDREDFLEAFLGETKKRPLDLPSFTALVESRGGRTFASTREYTRDMANVSHLNFNRDVLDRLLPSAMSFTNLKSFDDFCRRFVLPSEAVPVDDVTSSYRDFLSYNRELAELRRQLEHLNHIQSLSTLLHNAERDRDVARYLHAEAALEHARNLVASTEKRIQQLQSEDAVTSTRIAEIHAQIEHGKSERERLLSLLNESEDGRNYVYIKAEVQRLESKVSSLRSLSQRVEERLNLRVQQAEAWLQQVRDTATRTSLDTREVEQAIQRLASCESNATYTALAHLRHTATQLNAELKQSFNNESRELQVLRQQTDTLDEQIKGLKHGLPPIRQPLYHALNDALPRLPGRNPAHPLRELCEVNDETWREALEVVFTDKFALIVEPEHYDEAVRIYHQLKPSAQTKDAAVESLLHPTRVLSLSRTVLPGSLAEKIDTTHPIARALVDHLFGSLICCTDLADFLKQPGDAILPNGLATRAALTQRASHYDGTPFIGKRGLQRQLEIKIAQRRDIEAGIRRLEPIEDAIAKINSSLNQQIPDPGSMAQDLTRLEELPNLEEELARKQRDLNDINTAEFDSFASQAEEWRQRLDVLDQQRFDLATQSKSKEIKSQQEILAVRQNDVTSAEETFTHLKVQLGLTIDLERLRQWREDMQQQFPLLDVQAREFEKARQTNAENAIRFEGDLKQGMTAFKAEFSPRFDDFPDDGRHTAPYLNLLSRIGDADIPAYEQKALSERKNWEHLFRTQVLSRMHAALKKVEDIIYLLNQQLKRPIGRDRYKIERHPNPEFKFYRDLIELNSVRDQDDLFFASISGELRDALDLFLDTLVNKANSPEAARLLDYRQYYDYKLFSSDINNPEAKPIDVDKQSGKMSGGENQSPYFVAILASYLHAYNRHEKRWKEPSLALVPIDEAFSKLSGERIQDCITAVGELDMQGLFSMSSGNIPYAFQLCDELIVITKREDRVAGKTRIRNVPSILMRDTPEGQQWMQKYGA